MLRAPLLLIVLFFYGRVSGQGEPTSDDIDAKRFDPSLLMWYRSPAKKWEEALPVGNGRLGAMVYGNPVEEIIQLNEDTYWSGGPYSTTVPGGHKKLTEVQQLVFDQQFLKAHNLFGRHLMGYPVEQMKYQSLANLHLKFQHHRDTSNYKRWLDLKSGITHVAYTVNGVRYHQEVFSSTPDQVIVVRITCDRPGALSFTANLRGVRNQTHSNYATDYFRMDGSEHSSLVLTGKSADYLGVEGKLRYEAKVNVINEGGRISVDDYLLTVQDANAATIFFAAATNFVSYNDVSGNAHDRLEQYLEKIQHKEFSAIRQDHVRDVQDLMERVSIQLPASRASFLPTDERLKNDQHEADPALAALAYQFGRYVMIGASRPGTQAANLQGIWNNDQNPAWDSKYTTNINTQMNYWAVQSANLAECVEPLERLVREITDQGTAVAREHYGAKGWVLHQNTDLWRVAAPMDGPTWGTFTTGGAWLTNELWEQYRYTQDKTWASQFYPVMKGSVAFFLDFLVPHPNGKWMVTNPSTSPENFPMSAGNERYFDEVTGSYIPGTTICAGSSIDMQIIYDLFTNFMEASALLNLDRDMADSVSVMRSKLVPPQIGKDGSLQEWTEDWGQLEKNHRHFSHLYGLYPGNVFSLRKTPAFIGALKAVLNQRGDEGAGWSRAWKVALWARLHDGERAEKVLRGYLRDQAYPQLFAKCFTPMQVDGTLGMTAGISEMLIQSHESAIEFIPALPKSWSSGQVAGIRARGGFQIDLHWDDMKLKHVLIQSLTGKTCAIYWTGKTPKVLSAGKSLSVKRKGDRIEFATVAGQSYEVKIAP